MARVKGRLGRRASVGHRRRSRVYCFAVWVARLGGAGAAGCGATHGAGHGGGVVRGGSHSVKPLLCRRAKKSMMSTRARPGGGCAGPASVGVLRHDWGRDQAEALGRGRDGSRAFETTAPACDG